MKLLNGYKTVIPFDPELDVFCGIRDDELTERFRQAVELANMEKRIKGVSVAGYELEEQKGFLGVSRWEQEVCLNRK